MKVMLWHGCGKLEANIDLPEFRPVIELAIQDQIVDNNAQAQQIPLQQATDRPIYPSTHPPIYPSTCDV